MKIKKLFIELLILLFPIISFAQEMFISSEVASNMAKGRKQIDIFINGNKEAGSYTSYLGLQYGITGNLTSMNRIYFSTNEKNSFFGDVEIGGSYRFYTFDKQNYHLRWSFFSHLKIPTKKINSTPLNTIQNMVISDLYKTENYSLNIGNVFTHLKDRTALNIDASYNLNFPKGGYKFGNYIKGGISLGYLLLPKVYHDYNDLNLNLYLEPKGYYFYKNTIDNIAVANTGGMKFEILTGAQFIFNSAILFEFGYVKSFGDKDIKFEKNIYFTSIRYLFF